MKSASLQTAGGARGEPQQEPRAGPSPPGRTASPLGCEAVSTVPPLGPLAVRAAVRGCELLTSWSTLSVAMHWLLARVVISRLFGVSIRQLQSGTSWRLSVSTASGPLASPRIRETT